MAGEMSATIGEIAGALAKAQASLGKLVAGKTAKLKGKAKGSGQEYEYSYTYANLADALAACRGTLNAEGIAVLQLPATPSGNGIEVTTMLAHSSGEWIRSEPLFMPVSGGAQDVGSAITYARRYQLLAMVGLAPEDDDDGAAAQNAKPKTWATTPTSLGARCSGKNGGAIAEANERRMRALVEEDPDSDLGDVWHWALKSAQINVGRYGANGPGTAHVLTIPDGIKVRQVLTAQCITLGLEEPDPT